MTYDNPSYACKLQQVLLQKYFILYMKLLGLSAKEMGDRIGVSEQLIRNFMANPVRSIIPKTDYISIMSLLEYESHKQKNPQFVCLYNSIADLNLYLVKRDEMDAFIIELRKLSKKVLSKLTDKILNLANNYETDEEKIKAVIDYQFNSVIDQIPQEDLTEELMSKINEMRYIAEKTAKQAENSDFDIIAFSMENIKYLYEKDGLDKQDDYPLMLELSRKLLDRTYKLQRTEDNFYPWFELCMSAPSLPEREELKINQMILAEKGKSKDENCKKIDAAIDYLIEKAGIKPVHEEIAEELGISEEAFFSAEE